MQRNESEEGLVWLRGEATIQSGVVVLESSSAISYHVTDDISLAFDLAKVQNAKSALRFVRSWGLLRHGRPDDDLREPLNALRQQGERLNSLLITWMAYQEDEVCSALRPAVMLAWRQGWDRGVHPSPGELKALRDHLSMLATDLAADVRRVAGRDASSSSRSLLSHAYEMLARAIEMQILFAVCKECGAVFPVRDYRQTFCSPACSNRARQRRHYGRSRGELAMPQPRFQR